MAIASDYLDHETASGVHLDYELRFGPDVRYRLAIDGDRVAVSPADSGHDRPDCVITADPAAFLLVAYGRVGQWSQIQRGKAPHRGAPSVAGAAVFVSAHPPLTSRALTLIPHLAPRRAIASDFVGYGKSERRPAGSPVPDPLVGGERRDSVLGRGPCVLSGTSGKDPPRRCSRLVTCRHSSPVRATSGFA
jgi:hypothetical protein